MQINSSYTFSCSNVVSSIDVSPLYNEYIEGINSDLTPNGIYTYTFKLIKTGNTNFSASFIKGNSPVFTPFSKSIRIISGGSVVAGTQLDISFFQEDTKKALSELVPNILTSLLIKDVLTSSVVPSYTIYLNGKVINNSFTLDANKIYELIVDSPSYTSKTLNFSLTPKYIDISLSPSSGFIEGNSIFINSTPSNVSIFLDGNKILGNSITPSSGNHTLEFITEGYLNNKINFTVNSYARISSISSEWKKGDLQNIILSKVASWEILYAKDNTAQSNSVSSGTGTNISYTPEKAGIYSIKLDGNQIDQRTVKGFNWSAKWWFMAWYWWIIGGTVLFIVIIILAKRRGGGGHSNLSDGGFQMKGIGGSE
jgi:hypothetical protein